MKSALILLLAIGACGPDVPPFCGAAENIHVWQIQTNPNVATAELPFDACRRQTQAVVTLMPGGQVTLFRAVAVESGRVRPYVQVESNVTAPCAQVEVSLDAASHLGTVASFATDSGSPEAKIRVWASQHCRVAIRPMIQVGDTP